MSNLVLWQLTGSPPSWTVRMMADILGLKLELRDINFMSKEHKSEEFRKMNPMGTIPVLKDGDFIISESHTIIKYLLDKYGDETKKYLYPSTVEERALVDQIMFFDAGVAFIRVKNIALPSTFEGLEGVTPKLAAECDDVYDTVERYLGAKSFLASDMFTFADLCLGSTILALNSLRPLDGSRFPRTASWSARLRSISYFQHIAVPGSDALGIFVKSMWQKNRTQTKQTAV